MNRFSITKNVAYHLGEKIPIINGAFDFSYLVEEIEKYHGIVAITNTLPPSKEYANNPKWCGDNFEFALEMQRMYATATYSGDFGVTFVNLDASNIDALPVYDRHEYFDGLKEKLNATNDIDTLVASLKTVKKENPSLEDLTDDELKETYKTLFGQYPRGRFNREKIIEKCIVGEKDH